MKKNILFFLFIFGLTYTGFAQTDVTLKINHKLGDGTFGIGMSTQNNLDNDFNVARLEYYISRISLLHDDNVTTTVDDLWILADASETTAVALGNFDVTNIQAVRFHIGVSEAFNHLDPAAYAADHPLAPQLPSMHWGWAGGYRFVAMEGKSGNNLSETYEIHALGDENYFMTEIPVSLTAENGAVLIELDADYAKAMKNVDLSAGMVVHGGFGDAVVLLENFRDYVFTPAALSAGIIEIAEDEFFSVYPNPSYGGVFNLNYTVPSNTQFEIIITDALGRNVDRFDLEKNQNQATRNLTKAGFYFVSLANYGKVIQTKKLMVKI